VVGYCKERAEAGDYNAMLWLARMYRDGKGVRKNASKALEWYKKAKDHNVYAKFESLAMLSNRERKFENIPEGLVIDKRKKERLFVYKFNGKSMGLLVHLFPFTHYNVVGFSYEDKGQVGYNEGCEDYDKILVANIYDSFAIRDGLISEGISADKIITAKRYLDKEKFDGDAIVCDFGKEVSDKKAWVVVPYEGNGLIWHYNSFKSFKGEDKSKCDYVVDMQNHDSMMIDHGDIGRYNPWHYYFKPVSSLTLDEAYTRKEVIISRWTPSKSKRTPPDLPLTLSDTLNNRIDAEFKNFNGWDRTIGVIARGTDFVSIQPYNHPVPLDEYELVEIVEERMKNLGFAHTYLSTEDQEVYDFFKNRFGDKMFAIEQMRFKKVSTLNATLFNNDITEPFGKLIQGERYLIATHLVTKCKLALVFGGSGLIYVRRNSSCIAEWHAKGAWGQFGNAPLIVCSHNKNHFSIDDANCECRPANSVYSSGCIQMGVDQEVFIEDVNIYLDAKKRYVCSFNAEEPDSISISIELHSWDGETKVIELRHGDTFTTSTDFRSGNVAIRRGSSCNSEIGVQIEEGDTPTSYEPSRYSWTQICLKDTAGNEYALENIDYIDFNKGVFSTQGTERILDYEEIHRYHEIVCFKRGFLTYCRGEYHGNQGLISKTSIREAVSPQCIIGKPKQLRRFSHTVSMADNLIKGSEGDIERAICIYTYHATNGDTTAMGRLARAYRDGKGVEKNLDLAIEWMTKAKEKNLKWTRLELADLLIKRGIETDQNKAYALCSELAGEGHAGAMGRLGRMYRDGKGVEKNLDLAIEWMRIAAETRPVKNELMDMLWMRGNPEDYTEMRDVALTAVKEEDAGAMGRLGRMYRDGKGVEKDVNKAIDWMRIAAEKKIDWAEKELNEILKSIGSEFDTNAE